MTKKDVPKGEERCNVIWEIYTHYHEQDREAVLKTLQVLIKKYI